MITREKLIAHILQSNIFKSWHWFNWHFQHVVVGEPQPFADSLIEACLACEKSIPNFAIGTINNIASISGREKDLAQYEQLIQRLAEIHIIKQIVTFDWATQPTFDWEPTAQSSKKNPEIAIHINKKVIGVEVKAPSLLKHYKNQQGNSTQFLSRVRPLSKTELSDPKIILPRDNPLKDFLVSANEKFRAFKTENPEFIGILVIVWGMAIQEPLSALLTDGSGLLTKDSFAKDKQGNALQFPNIDGVIVVSHLHQIMKATKGEFLIDDCRDAFDYGFREHIPFKIFIPLAPNVPEDFLECMQVHLPDYRLGSEYVPADIIWWIAPNENDMEENI